jgi:AcrR family transcriptional regulator
MRVNRRERRKERTRQGLLDVAVELIGERGIYGTRVEDITERSDLGKGAFYNYFASKDALIAALVAQGVELLHRRYHAEPSAGASPAERIAAVVAAHEAFFAENPAYLVLFHQARGLIAVRPDEHAALRGIFREYLGRTGEVITSADDRARMDPEVLADLAAVVLGAIAGHHSFRFAAGLDAGGPVVAGVLAAGVPAELAARRGARDVAR